MPCLLYSMPTATVIQWDMINNMNTSYITPDYYWGDARFNHLKDPPLVYSHIYHFNKWQENTPSQEKMIFCFKQPLGTPCFSLVINESVLITPYKDAINQKTQTTIEKQERKGILCLSQ